ncbi:hypothetical protein LJ655_21240 [Paraburkholderia sp. MMS20-SJTN17]|uniref:CdiI immunity protein domain-containing protein n=1 Tax=Paraburkholderia translucens TaxID=2886945 RepID=A0ABS8KHZ0_9BURK|nr:contact-dependent growth inhibition system immunity protein [Paraburkholderia sp. MMS20-SJTN17]MCC8404374.1 hypothetical protein [Paraburkholderia sp. MMS20-SJTN17]
MMGEIEYPNLRLLFDGYLNQDYDLHGETYADVVRAYRSEIDEGMRLEAIAEIERFQAQHRLDLASAFESNFERELSITSRDYTAQSFLDELKRLLSE